MNAHTEMSVDQLIDAELRDVARVLAAENERLKGKLGEIKEGPPIVQFIENCLELREENERLRERVDYLEVENTMALESYSEYQMLNKQLIAENERLKQTAALRGDQ